MRVEGFHKQFVTIIFKDGTAIFPGLGKAVKLGGIGSTLGKKTHGEELFHDESIMKAFLTEKELEKVKWQLADLKSWTQMVAQYDLYEKWKKAGSPKLENEMTNPLDSEDKIQRTKNMLEVNRRLRKIYDSMRQQRESIMKEKTRSSYLSQILILTMVATGVTLALIIGPAAFLSLTAGLVTSTVSIAFSALATLFTGLVNTFSHLVFGNPVSALVSLAGTGAFATVGGYYSYQAVKSVKSATEKAKNFFSECEKKVSQKASDIIEERDNELLQTILSIRGDAYSDEAQDVNFEGLSGWIKIAATERINELSMTFGGPYVAALLYKIQNVLETPFKGWQAGPVLKAITSISTNIAKTVGEGVYKAYSTITNVFSYVGSAFIVYTPPEDIRSEGRKIKEKYLGAALLIDELRKEIKDFKIHFLEQFKPTVTYVFNFENDLFRIEEDIIKEHYERLSQESRTKNNPFLCTYELLQLATRDCRYLQEEQNELDISKPSGIYDYLFKLVTKTQELNNVALLLQKEVNQILEGGMAIREHFAKLYSSQEFKSASSVLFGRRRNRYILNIDKILDFYNELFTGKRTVKSTFQSLYKGDTAKDLEFEELILDAAAKDEISRKKTKGPPKKGIDSSTSSQATPSDRFQDVSKRPHVKSLHDDLREIESSPENPAAAPFEESKGDNQNKGIMVLTLQLLLILCIMYIYVRPKSGRHKAIITLITQIVSILDKKVLKKIMVNSGLELSYTGSATMQEKVMYKDKATDESSLVKRQKLFCDFYELIPVPVTRLLYNVAHRPTDSVVDALIAVFKRRRRFDGTVNDYYIQFLNRHYVLRSQSELSRSSGSSHKRMSKVLELSRAYMYVEQASYYLSYSSITVDTEELWSPEGYKSRIFSTLQDIAFFFTGQLGVGVYGVILNCLKEYNQCRDILDNYYKTGERESEEQASSMKTSLEDSSSESHTLLDKAHVTKAASKGYTLEPLVYSKKRIKICYLKIMLLLVSVAKAKSKRILFLTDEDVFDMNETDELSKRIDAFKKVIEGSETTDKNQKLLAIKIRDNDPICIFATQVMNIINKKVQEYEQSLEILGESGTIQKLKPEDKFSVNAHLATLDLNVLIFVVQRFPNLKSALLSVLREYGLWSGDNESTDFHDEIRLNTLLSSTLPQFFKESTEVVVDSSNKSIHQKKVERVASFISDRLKARRLRQESAKKQREELKAKYRDGQTKLKQGVKIFDFHIKANLQHAQFDSREEGGNLAVKANQKKVSYAGNKIQLWTEESGYKDLDNLKPWAIEIALAFSQNKTEDILVGLFAVGDTIHTAHERSKLKKSDRLSDGDSDTSKIDENITNMKNALIEFQEFCAGFGPGDLKFILESIKEFKSVYDGHTLDFEDACQKGSQKLKKLFGVFFFISLVDYKQLKLSDFLNSSSQVKAIRLFLPIIAAAANFSFSIRFYKLIVKIYERIYLPLLKGESLESSSDMPKTGILSRIPKPKITTPFHDVKIQTAFYKVFGIPISFDNGGRGFASIWSFKHLSEYYEKGLELIKRDSGFEFSKKVIKVGIQEKEIDKVKNYVVNSKETGRSYFSLDAWLHVISSGLCYFSPHAIAFMNKNILRSKDIKGPKKDPLGMPLPEPSFEFSINPDEIDPQDSQTRKEQVLGQVSDIFTLNFNSEIHSSVDEVSETPDEGLNDSMKTPLPENLKAFNDFRDLFLISGTVEIRRALEKYINDNFEEYYGEAVSGDIDDEAWDALEFGSTNIENVAKKSWWITRTVFGESRSQSGIYLMPQDFTSPRIQINFDFLESTDELDLLYVYFTKCFFKGANKKCYHALVKSYELIDDLHDKKKIPDGYTETGLKNAIEEAFKIFEIRSLIAYDKSSSESTTDSEFENKLLRYCQEGKTYLSSDKKLLPESFTNNTATAMNLNTLDSDPILRKFKPYIVRCFHDLNPTDIPKLRCYKELLLIEEFVSNLDNVNPRLNYLPYISDASRKRKVTKEECLRVLKEKLNLDKIKFFLTFIEAIFKVQNVSQEFTDTKADALIKSIFELESFFQGGNSIELLPNNLHDGSRAFVLDKNTFSKTSHFMHYRLFLGQLLKSEPYSVTVRQKLPFHALLYARHIKDNFVFADGRVITHEGDFLKKYYGDHINSVIALDSMIAFGKCVEFANWSQGRQLLAAPL